MLAAMPIISEFLASNTTGSQDEDGDRSDWIEIYNAGDAAADLDGWHLTDNASNLNQWSFPNVSLEAGQYLVIFASNKNRADADGTELHTNFKLGASGEYLALVESDGSTVAFEYAPSYPGQSTDISFGVKQQGTETTLIAEGTSARYIVPSGAISGWNTLGFSDTSWQQGLTGIGYENNPADYAPYLETTVPSGTRSLYTRQTFQVADPADVNGLTLKLRYDDGFAAYLNGTLVASHNAPGTLAYNSVASGEHVDSQAIGFVDFDLSSHPHTQIRARLV